MRRILLALGASLAASHAAHAQCVQQKIELTPTDVGSASSSTFSVLPTGNPGTFGLTGSLVGTADFDTDALGGTIAAGTFLTDEYAALGMSANSIRIDNNVYGGPASAPNATEHNTPQVFTFDTPVVAAGIINTSPDHDNVELWSGSGGTGTLLMGYVDQDGLPRNFNIDRFVGGRVCGSLIGSMVLYNATGDLELDELLWEVPTDLLLVAGFPVQGSAVTLEVLNAPPGATVAFAGSLAGPGSGPCPPALGGVCVGLTSPILLGTASASAGGRATLAVTVPAGVPLGDAWAQAFVVAGAASQATEIVQRTIAAP